MTMSIRELAKRMNVGMDLEVVTTILSDYRDARHLWDTTASITILAGCVAHARFRDTKLPARLATALGTVFRFLGPGPEAAALFDRMGSATTEDDLQDLYSRSMTYVVHTASERAESLDAILDSLAGAKNSAEVIRRAKVAFGAGDARDKTVGVALCTMVAAAVASPGSPEEVPARLASILAVTEATLERLGGFDSIGKLGERPAATVMIMDAIRDAIPYEEWEEAMWRTDPTA